MSEKDQAHFARLANFWESEAAIARAQGDADMAKLFQEGANNARGLIRSMADHYGRAIK